MKVEYRGYEIEVTRGRNMTGTDVLLFYSIFRKDDGYELTSGYSYSGETVREFLSGLKETVDEAYEHPDRFFDDE